MKAACYLLERSGGVFSSDEEKWNREHKCMFLLHEGKKEEHKII